jgi:fucose 4-O-acetylase-like acetyltransferase
MAPRFAAIDALKALGILAILLVHATRPPWHPLAEPLDHWLGHVTRFGVPAFLFASGFLYASRAPVAAHTTRRRLRRILVPYAVASLLVQLARAAAGDSRPSGSLLLEMLLGSTLGPYYYVFVIAVLVACTPLFARLTPRAVGLATLGLVLAHLCVDAATLLPMPLFWHLRSPLTWWAFFALGWLVRLQRHPLARWLAPRRRLAGLALAALITGLAAFIALEPHAPRLWIRSAAWLLTYAVLAWVYIGASGWQRTPRGVLWLSEASYAIYLFHPFVGAALARHTLRLSPAARGLAVGMQWIGSLAGSALLVTAARRVLGARSRGAVGA